MKARTYRTQSGGERSARYVTPDLSYSSYYYWEGAGRQGDDDKWEGGNNINGVTGVTVFPGTIVNRTYQVCIQYRYIYIYIYYISTFFYYQYLVLFTTVPRSSMVTGNRKVPQVLLLVSAL